MSKRIVCCIVGAMILGMSVSGLCEVKGKVVNHEGKPIPAAKVMAYSPGPQGWKSQTLWTDKSGAFKYSPPGEGFAFIAMAQGYSLATTQHTMPGGKDVVLKLWPEQKLRGTVVDERGKPIPGAVVKLQRLYAYAGGASIQFDARDDFGPVLQTITGEDGSFVLLHLPSPEHFRDSLWPTITVTKGGRALVEQSMGSREMDQELEIVLPVECKIEGTVYLPGKTGTAPEGTILNLQVHRSWPMGGRMRSWSEHRSTQVGKDGKFAVPKLPPGKTTVLFRSREHVPGPPGEPMVSKPTRWILPATDVELAPKETKAVELVLTEGALVSGKLVNKETDEPIPNAELVVRDGARPPNSVAEHGQTDKDGNFELRTLAGEVSIAVRSYQSDREYVYFQENEMPTLVVSVSDGEEKSGLVLKASARDTWEGRQKAARKPVPPDLELNPGTYELSWDPELTYSELVSHSAKYEDKEARSRIKRLPKLISKKPLVSLFALDGTGIKGLLAIVLDESAGTGKGFDTAYVDTNRNGDLSDEEALKWKQAAEDYDQYTSWVTVQSHQGKPWIKRTDHPLQVRLYIQQYSDYFSARPQMRGGWKGTIESNKGKLDCAVIDVNRNGSFSDRSRLRNLRKLDLASIGDVVGVDTNGFGGLALSHDSRHVMMLNEAVALAGKLYSVQVSDIGDKLTIAPYTGPTGTLLVQGKGITGLEATTESLWIAGTSGIYQFEDLPEGPLLLPVGKYVAPYCSLALQPKGGKKVSVACELDAETEIKANEQTTLTVGGKVTVAINPKKKDMVLKAKSSEPVSWIMKIGDNATVRSIAESAEPKVTFLDSKGKVLASGTARYT